MCRFFVRGHNNVLCSFGVVLWTMLIVSSLDGGTFARTTTMDHATGFYITHIN